MANPTQRDQVFISYSHKDRKILEQLQTVLRPLVRSQKISVWDDTKIRVGDEWREEIKKAIASAKVAVLLVSPDFLASDFIADHELLPLLDAAQNEGLIILWIAVRHSLYEETEIARYQAVNDPSKPLASLSAAARERELVRICFEIKVTVARTEQERPAPGEPDSREPRVNPKQPTPMPPNIPPHPNLPLMRFHDSAPLASWIFGGLILIFLMVVVFVDVSPNKFPIVRFLMSLSAAFFAFFFVGGVLLHGTLKGLYISATGGFVLFILMQFVFDPFAVLPTAIPHGGNNPSGNVVATFEPPSAINSADLVIKSDSGKVVLSISIKSGTRQTVSLPSGNYTYELQHIISLPQDAPPPCYQDVPNPSYGTFEVYKDRENITKLPELSSLRPIPGCTPQSSDLPSSVPLPTQSSVQVPNAPKPISTPTPSPSQTPIPVGETKVHVRESDTERVPNSEITISVSKVTVDRLVTASIGSDTGVDYPINNRQVGYKVDYRVGKTVYRIRIDKVEYIGSYVDFTVKVIKR